jgi:hypothetical protein
MRKLQPGRHGQGRGELGAGQWILELGAGQFRNELTNCYDPKQKAVRRVEEKSPRGSNERALNLKFRANAAWIASRQDDLRAFLGAGHVAIAMSFHWRLGSKIDCLLGKLHPEVLRIIVNLLDS